MHNVKIKRKSYVFVLFTFFILCFMPFISGNLNSLNFFILNNKNILKNDNIDQFQLNWNSGIAVGYPDAIIIKEELFDKNIVKICQYYEGLTLMLHKT